MLKTSKTKQFVTVIVLMYIIYIVEDINQKQLLYFTICINLVHYSVLKKKID